MSVTGFDPQSIRSAFPALQTQHHGQDILFFDGPARTQTPISVIGAISNYYLLSNSFHTNLIDVVTHATELTKQARESAAHFLNAPDPNCVLFGANVTTLTYAVSAAYGRVLSADDEIIISQMDHEANRAPWMDLAEKGIVIRTAEIDPTTGTLSAEAVTRLITPRTRLIAVTLASNITGSIVDVASISAAAHSVGAAVYVDANHYAAHAPIDVQALDCDFLSFASYKCFGPHLGILWGKRELLEHLTPSQLPSAPSALPECWEQGGQNLPALASVPAMVRYLSNLGAQAMLFANPLPSLGGSALPTAVLHAGMHAIQKYERTLSEKMLDLFAGFPEIRVLGLTDPARLHERVPTFSFVWMGQSSAAVETTLNHFGILCSRGSFYCPHLLQRLNVDPANGVVRIGLLHYNTIDEIAHLQSALEGVRAEILSEL